MRTPSSLPLLGAKDSIKESNSASLRFQLVEERINYARHVVEDPNNRFASNEGDVIKPYIECKADPVHYPRVGHGRTQNKLISCSIPLGWEHYISHPADLIRVGSNNPERDSCKSFMFACICQFVDGPECINPSLVRLERPKKFQDFLREARTRTL